MRQFGSPLLGQLLGARDKGGEGISPDDGARFDVDVRVDAADIRPTLFGSQSTALPDQAMLDREALRGLRIKLTPQGITGASYLEIDFVDPAENVPLDRKSVV